MDVARADLGLERGIRLTVPCFATADRVLDAHPSWVCTVPSGVAETLFLGNAQPAPTPLVRPPIRYDAFWHERPRSDPVHRALRDLRVEVAAAV